MLVVLKDDAQEIGREAARMVASAIHRKPDLTLGLATGSTTVGLYREIVRLHREEGLDLSRVVTFNLDEYLGLKRDHPQSFYHFMQAQLFSHVNIQAQNIHIPDGTITGNYDGYCASYEESIRNSGGVDLQILGIGRNGHIGFNEPTSSLASRTRLKVLNPETIEDNRKFFLPTETMPECAITMGVGTIRDARRILILATGAAKAEAVHKAIEGPITASVPASVLQLHPDVTFLLDSAASALLTQKEYYREVLRMTALLTPDRYR